MFGPIAYFAAIVVFVFAWSRFAAHRKSVMQHIEADRQRRIDNELTDMTLRAIRFQELTPAEWAARAEVEAMWRMHDREAQS